MEEEKQDQIEEEKVRQPVVMDQNLLGKPATDNKYDRQIRLWGSHGQKALMDAKILLVGGAIPGVETIKNLVLPGVGSIHIMDDMFVTKQDTGCNFFTPFSTIGQLRARVLVEYLSQMNADVSTFKDIIRNPLKITSNCLSAFNFVIINQQPEEIVQHVSKICEELSIKYIIQKNQGFIGYLRAYSPNHTIIEAKQQSVSIQDIRLNNPFKGLLEYSEKFKFDELTEVEHCHVPYPVILLQELDKWNSSHEDKQPENFKQKQEFKEQIKQSCKAYQIEASIKQEIQKWKESNKNEDIEEEFKCPGEEQQKIREAQEKKTYMIELNFEEATKNISKLFEKKEELPGPCSWQLEEVFKEVDKQDESTCEEFWVLVKTLKKFWEEENRFPLLGSIPDMVSSTENYLELQKIYKAESEEDKASFTKLISQINNENGKNIPEENINLFLKNSQILAFVNYRTYSQEIESPQFEPQYPETDCYKWHLAMNGLEQYEKIYKSMPDTSDKKTVTELLGFINCTIARQFPGRTPIKEIYAEELCRYQKSQFSPAACFMGGIAAQEVIKLITHQYLSINNTLIYNGMTSEIETYTF